MARNYAALPWEYRREMGCLTDAEFGRLCRALLEYSEFGTPPALSGNERFFAERVMAQEQRYQENYEAAIEQKREAGRISAQRRKLRERGTDSNGGKHRSTALNGVEQEPTQGNGTNKTETEFLNRNQNRNRLSAEDREKEEKERESPELTQRQRNALGDLRIARNLLSSGKPELAANFAPAAEAAGAIFDDYYNFLGWKEAGA